MVVKQTPLLTDLTPFAFYKSNNGYNWVFLKEYYYITEKNILLWVVANYP